MGIRMPGLDGLEATRLLRTGPHAAASGTKIVIVTTFDLDEYAYQALRVGANGFIVKNSGSRLLLEAVHAAAQGESLISPFTTVRLLKHLNRLPAQRNTEQLQRLTPQELKVATLVARGRTNNGSIRDSRPATVWRSRLGPGSTASSPEPGGPCATRPAASSRRPGARGTSEAGNRPRLASAGHEGAEIPA
ncbi:response regulator transcription factor [Streptomyces sp. NPDC041003]|uniref:response regulator n=1 Tax=Streptomyces sp. NPDC041003 TaxID=3155730 RepID=UPI0033D6221F